MVRIGQRHRPHKGNKLSVIGANKNRKSMTRGQRRCIKQVSGPRPRRPSSPVSIWGSFDSVKCTRLLGRVTAIERAVITSRWKTSGSKSLPSLLDVLRHCTALLSKAWSYKTVGSQRVNHEQRQGTDALRGLAPLKNCHQLSKPNLSAAQSSTA